MTLLALGATLCGLQTAHVRPRGTREANLSDAVTRVGAEQTEHTCDEVAAELRVPLRTVQRQVGVLARLGARGIRRGQREDMARWGWLVSGELLEQWKRGEVPAPWESAVPSEV